MADITQDSFLKYAYPRYQAAIDGGGPFDKVVFQRGRDVRDSELNEAQDILRVFMLNTMLVGMQTTTPDHPTGTGVTLNPCSSDAGYFVQATGNPNEVRLLAGTLFCDGIPLNIDVNTTMPPLPSPLVDANWTCYLAVTEVEVTDPSSNPQLGPTTKRRQIQVTFNVSITGDAGVPPNSVAPIWQGGTHYFIIATIRRFGGVDSIVQGNIRDRRFPSPATLANSIWGFSVGDGVTSFGFYNGAGSPTTASGIQNAITDLAAKGFIEIRLLVKQGVYYFNDVTQLVLPIGIRVIIEGYGDSTIINFVHATRVPLTSSAENYIEFRNVRMENVDSSNNFPCIDFSGGEMSLFQVTTRAILFYADGPLSTTLKDIAAGSYGAPVFYAKRCNLLMADDNGDFTVPMGCVAIHPEHQYFDYDGNPLATGSIVFEDCNLASCNNRPFVQVIEGFNAGLEWFNGVYFIRCVGSWGYVDVDTFAGTSSGIPVNSSGPVGFYPHIPSVGNTMICRRVYFEQCDFRARGNKGALPVGASPILLNIMPIAVGDITGTSYCEVSEVIINGGDWLSPPQATWFSQFIVVCPYIEINGGFTLHSNGVRNGMVPEDLLLYWTGSATRFGANCVIGTVGLNGLIGAGTEGDASSSYNRYGIQIDNLVYPDYPMNPDPAPWLTGPINAGTQDWWIVSGYRSVSKINRFEWGIVANHAGTATMEPTTRMTVYSTAESRQGLVIEQMFMRAVNSGGTKYLQSGSGTRAWFTIKGPQTWSRCRFRCPDVAGVHRSYEVFGHVVSSLQDGTTGLIDELFEGNYFENWLAGTVSTGQLPVGVRWWRNTFINCGKGVEYEMTSAPATARLAWLEVNGNHFEGTTVKSIKATMAAAAGGTFICHDNVGEFGAADPIDIIKSAVGAYTPRLSVFNNFFAFGTNINVSTGFTMTPGNGLETIDSYGAGIAWTTATRMVHNSSNLVLV